MILTSRNTADEDLPNRTAMECNDSSRAKPLEISLRSPKDSREEHHSPRGFRRLQPAEASHDEERQRFDHAQTLPSEKSTRNWVRCKFSSRFAPPLRDVDTRASGVAAANDSRCCSNLPVQRHE
jgi:hypothetical protein